MGALSETIEFGPGQPSAEKPDGHQARAWALLSTEAEAAAVLRAAEASGGDVTAATAERGRARAVVETFLRAHPGRAFAAFRPADIARAFDADIAPLFGDGPASDAFMPPGWSRRRSEQQEDTSDGHQDQDLAGGE